MKLAGGKSIALNLPMRRLSLTAGFAALTKAVSFAEEILAKYEKPEEDSSLGETLVFLKHINGELRRAEALRNEFSLTVRLMIARQLTLSGKLGSPAVGREYPAAAERLIERMSTDLRSYGVISQQRLSEIRRIIETEEGLAASLTQPEAQEQSIPGILRVDAASLIHSVYERYESTAPRAQTVPISLFPETTLLFRTNTYNTSESSAPLTATSQNLTESQTTQQTNIFEQNTQVSNVGDSVSIGKEINVSSEEYSYSSENLVHKDETSETSETTQQTNISEQNTQVSNTEDRITLGNEINVSSEEYSYSSESLVHKEETTETSETTQRTNISEQSTQVSNVGDSVTLGNEINVSSEEYSYNSESLLHKEETSETTETTQQTNISEQSTQVSNMSDSVTIGNEINVSSEEYSYNSESLVHNDETSETSETTQQTNISEQTTQVSNVSDSITLGNEINVSSEEYSYNSESLVHKDETFETSETTQQTNISEQSTQISNVGDSVTLGNEINVSSEDYSYNSESLVHKDEASENTEITQQTKISEQSTQISNVGDSVTLGNEINVSSEDYSYSSESLVHIDESAAADGAAPAMILNSFVTQASRHFAALAAKEPGAVLGWKITASAGMKLNTQARAGAELRELLRSGSLLRETESRLTEKTQSYDTRTEQVLRERDTEHNTERQRLRENIITEKEIVSSAMSEEAAKSASVESRADSAGNPGAKEAEPVLSSRVLQTVRLLTENLRREERLTAERISEREIRTVSDRTMSEVLRSGANVSDSVHYFSEELLRLRYQTGGLAAENISTSAKQRRAAAFARAQRYEAPAQANAPEKAETTQNNSVVFNTSFNTTSLRAGDRISEIFESLDLAQTTADLYQSLTGRQPSPETNNLTNNYENISYNNAEYSFDLTAKYYSTPAVLLPGTVIRNVTVIPPARSAMPKTAAAQAGSRETSAVLSFGGEAVGYGETSAPLSLLESPRAEAPGTVQSAPVPSPRITAPTSDMLIRQYGNLIDGADPTGRTLDLGSSFGQPSESSKAIRELASAVKTAAEKSAENSRLIDELKKKQDEIESGALKADDMRLISDEVITRLRTELRLDRSRYSG